MSTKLKSKPPADSLRGMVGHPMEPITLRALQESIAHWRRMATGKALPAEAPTASQCDLCSLFLGTPHWCHGCPVEAKFGKNCNGTPYHDAARAYLYHGLGSNQFKMAAHRELKCLTALLPKKRKMPND